jgi:[acyl-carrier-protein] S-malonyltransferase
VVSPANLNAPGQVVIASTAAAAARRSLAKAATKRVIPLAGAPFHCADEAAEIAGPRAGALAVQAPRGAVVASIDAQPKGCEAPPPWRPGARVSGAVQWEAWSAALHPGVRTYVEVGPARYWRGWYAKIDRDARVANLEDPADSTPWPRCLLPDIGGPDVSSSMQLDFSAAWPS